MKKDLDYIVKLEKAISQKYGKEAIQNPKGNWDEKKEKDYIQQLEKIYKNQSKKDEQSEKVEVEGFLITRKLINKETNRKCPVCKNYSFDIEDDIYMNKFDCCCKCYINFIEGREKRWNSGWRPNLGDE